MENNNIILEKIIFENNIECDNPNLSNTNATNYLILLNILKQTIENDGPKITDSSSFTITQIINGTETKSYSSKVDLDKICKIYSFKQGLGGNKTKKYKKLKHKKTQKHKKTKRLRKNKTQKRRKRTHRRR